MPAKNEDLHGSAPDRADVALLLIDVINDLEFPEGEQILRFALPMAQQIAALKQRARQGGVPVIYVNDNFGRWRSDFREAVEHCLHDDVRGRPITELLEPQKEDYFVLKPKHSAFFSTALETLLKYLRTRRLIVTGYAADVCVLLTTADAYLRDFELVVPRDCCASQSAAETRKALEYMKRVFHVDTSPSGRVEFADKPAQKRSSGRR